MKTHLPVIAALVALTLPILSRAESPDSPPRMAKAEVMPAPPEPPRPPKPPKPPRPKPPKPATPTPATPSPATPSPNPAKPPEPLRFHQPDSDAIERPQSPSPTQSPAEPTVIIPRAEDREPSPHPVTPKAHRVQRAAGLMAVWQALRP